MPSWQVWDDKSQSKSSPLGMTSISILQDCFTFTWHKETFFCKNHMSQPEIGLLCGGECKSDLEMSHCALPETKSACSDVVKPKVLRNGLDDNCTASTSSSTKSEFICLSNPSTCWNVLRSAFSSWLKIRWNVGHFSALWKHPLKLPSNPHWI